ncbi:MAG TPA: hypothetical protein VM282_26990, partial [Acidimicrobiales bacterium]|nr:hypothetical protein [Acidimicrobiales bacterium]
MITGRRGVRHIRAAVASSIAVALVAIAAPAALATPLPLAQTGLARAQEVQTVWTRDLGVARPSGLAYDPKRRQFLISGEAANETVILRMGHDEEFRGTSRVARLANPRTLAFDATEDALTAVDGADRVAFGGEDITALGSSPPRRTSITSLGLREPSSATVDPRTGTWHVLERGANAIASVNPNSTTATRRSLPFPASVIAFNPSDSLLYAMSPSRNEIHGLDADGNVTKSYSLELVTLVDPVAMTFAPSTDPTDDPDNLNLFIADAGGPQSSGGVTEASLDIVTTAVTTLDTATLMRLTHTSQWSPASPDPSGVTWMPGVDQLVVVDSEVDETTGAGWHDVNMWRTDRLGAVVGTGTTWGPNAATVNGSVGYSREPTGVGYDAATNTLFISDDSAGKVFVVKPGSDNRFGTSDDVVTWVDMNAYGSTDTEDPEFDPATGHLFVLDGVGMEIYRINPVDGIFGNGNDSMTHFDISHLGPRDFEGLTRDPGRGTLYVGARSTKQIFEIDQNDGTLIRTIDASGIPDLTFISGLAVYPASDGSGVMRMGIVDRAVDNGPDPNENDGKLFEIAVPNIGSAGPLPNQAPVVDAGADQFVVLPDAAVLSGSVTDDGLPAGGTLTQAWSVVSGPGPVTFGDATAASTTATFTTVGVYVLRLTATDTELTASDDVTITVAEQGTPGVAPLFRSASSAALTGASGSVLSLLRPDGVQAGDLLLAQIRYRDSTLGLTAPAGWTLVGNIVRSQANHAVYYKIAGASEPAGYAFDQNTDAGRMAVGIGAYVGVNAAAPINAWAASSADLATLVAPTVTTTVNNTMVLRLWGWRGVSATNAGVGFNTVPAGVTQRWTEQVGHANDDRNRILAGDQVQATAGATGTATAAGSASTDENRRNAFTIALTPMGGGGEPANQAPVVDAGADQSVVLPNSATLNGTVTDDGLPTGATVTHTWSMFSGP